MSIALTVDVFACPCDAEIVRVADAILEGRTAVWLPTPGTAPKFTLLQDTWLPGEYWLVVDRQRPLSLQQSALLRFHPGTHNTQRALAAARQLREEGRCPDCVECGGHFQLRPAARSRSRSRSPRGEEARRILGIEYALEL